MNIAQKFMALPLATLIGTTGGIKTDAANAARAIITEHPSQVEVVSKDGAQSLKARLGNFERKVADTQLNEHRHSKDGSTYVCPATHKEDLTDCSSAGWKAPERPQDIADNALNEHSHSKDGSTYVCPATHKEDLTDCSSAGFKAPERPQEIANNQLNEHFHGDKTCPATHKEDKSDCT
jgi:hypothetical protein